MDSSILENQMDTSIQSGKSQLQQQYNATASAYTSKVDGVLHDITMPSGALLLGNIGKGAVAIARNTGLIDAPEGGYVDTMINKGVSGVVKKGVKQAISKVKGSSDADADSTTDLADTTADTTADTSSSLFSDVGSSTTGSLFKSVKITTDEEDLADAQSNLASTQSGSVSTASSSDAGLSLQGGDEDGVGARIASTAENSEDLGTEPQGSGAGGEAIEDSSKIATDTTEATETGADALTDTLATATEASTLFDDVPVVGLAATAVLAIGTEVASWFESTPAQKVSQLGVQASQTTGLDTI